LLFRKVWNDVRNHHVVTGHHDVLAFNLIRLVIIDIVDENIARTVGITAVLYVHNSAVESNSNTISGFI
jgi:hypothetical protein